MRSGHDGGSSSSPAGGQAGADVELLRWRDTSTDPSALPARAAALVDAARDVPPLAPVALARIRSAVTDPRRSPRSRGVPLGLRVALLATLLLVSVATAKGAMVLWQRYIKPAALEPAPARAKLALAPGPRRRVDPAPAVEVIDRQEAPAPPRPEPAPAVRAAAAPRARRAPVVAAAPAAAPPAESPAPANPVDEAQLLADALRRLRQAHDPAGALALLDQYEASYPRGVLAVEARSARVEAALKLGDRSGALALLDQRAAFAGRLGAEQLLTRAELRASVGRYAEALSDFDRVLAPSGGVGALQTAAVERALYGRAVTLGHLGRADRARLDLETYRRRFPAGRFAPEVERLLRSPAP